MLIHDAVEKMLNRLDEFADAAEARGDTAEQNRMTLLIVDLADVVKAIDPRQPTKTEENERVCH